MADIDKLLGTWDFSDLPLFESDIPVYLDVPYAGTFADIADDDLTDALSQSQREPGNDHAGADGSPQLGDDHNGVETASCDQQELQQSPAAHNQNEQVFQNQNDLVFQNQNDLVYQNQNGLVFQNQNEMAFQNQNDLDIQNQNEMAFQNQNDLVFPNQNDLVYQNQNDLVFQNQNKMDFQNQNDLVFQNQNGLDFQNQNEMDIQNQNGLDFQNQNESDSSEPDSDEIERRFAAALESVTQDVEKQKRLPDQNGSRGQPAGPSNPEVKSECFNYLGNFQFSETPQLQSFDLTHQNDPQQAAQSWQFSPDTQTEAQLGAKSDWSNTSLPLSEVEPGRTIFLNPDDGLFYEIIKFEPVTEEAFLAQQQGTSLSGSMFQNMAPAVEENVTFEAIYSSQSATASAAMSSEPRKRRTTITAQQVKDLTLLNRN